MAYYYHTRDSPKKSTYEQEIGTDWCIWCYEKGKLLHCAILLPVFH